MFLVRVEQVFRVVDVLIRPLAIRDGDKVFDRIGSVEVDLAVDAGCLFEGGTPRVDGFAADAAGLV